MMAVAGPGQSSSGNLQREPRSNPNVPTFHTLNDDLFAQFARIRSVAVETCDYGSGGRGFESLPARFTDPAF